MRKGYFRAKIEKVSRTRNRLLRQLAFASFGLVRAPAHFWENMGHPFWCFSTDGFLIKVLEVGLF